MCWLSFGVFAGFVDGLGFTDEDPNEYAVVCFRRVLVFCTPTIGGFFVVGQMISHYGVCTRIT